MLNRENPINSSSLVASLVALVLGIVLIVAGQSLLDILGYVVGGIVIFSGVIKFIAYIFSKKKYESTPFGDLLSSILFIALGIFVILNPGMVSFTISLVVGLVMIFTGINRLILGLAVKVIDKQGSTVFITESLLLILLGIIVSFGEVFNLIGWIVILYAISEIVGYVYYTSQNKDYSQVLNKKVTKEMREKEAKDAVIEE